MSAVRRRALWLTDEDWANLRDRAAILGMNPSVFIRTKLIGDPDVIGVDIPPGMAYAGSPRAGEVALVSDGMTEVSTETVLPDHPGRIRVDCVLCDWGTLAVPELAEREMAEHLAKVHPAESRKAQPVLDPHRRPRRKQPVDPTKETPTTQLAKQDPVLPEVPTPRPFRPAPKPPKKTR